MSNFLSEATALPTGTIRLLKPEASLDLGDDMHYSIFNVSLHEDIKYHALSYCWGGSTTSKVIIVQGKTIPITASLHQALRNFQSLHLAEPIWIDAICINQGNLVEKTNQVAQMQQIYMRAKHVVVWLGSADHGSESVMRWLRRIGSWALRLEIGSNKELYLINLLKRWSSSGAETMEADMEMFLTELHNSLIGCPRSTSGASSGQSSTLPLVMALGRFLSRAYWKRVWVIQEVYNAPSVEFFCGDLAIDEESLNAGLRVLRNFQYYHLMHNDFVGFNQLDTIHAINLLKIRRNGRGGARLPLVFLLRRFQRAASTLDVDRVFALLGMAADAHQLGINPDYSLTSKQAFVAVAQALLKSGHVEILSCCNNYFRPSGLPSWVPYWSSASKCANIQQRVGIAPTGDGEFQPHFDACGGVSSEPSIDWIGHQNVLSISATYVGRVVERGKLFKSDAAVEWLRQLYTYTTASGNDSCADCANGHLGDMNAVCATAVADQEIRQGRMKTRIDSSALEKVCACLTTWPDDLLTHLKNEGLEEYSQQLQAVARGRRPVKLDSGNIGLGSRDTRIGDSIFVVAGGSVPYVFRPVSAHQSVKLVGEMYVHGRMDGEATRSSHQEEILRII